MLSSALYSLIVHVCKYPFKRFLIHVIPQSKSNEKDKAPGCSIDEISEQFLRLRPDQGSYGYEKSWNLKMHFPGLEKSWILGKMVEVMEKSWN